MKTNRLIIITIIAVVVACALVLALRARGASAAPAQPEVVPSPAQQKPILDLLAEQKRMNEQKNAEISGASRMLMSQLFDPITKQTGLDPTKWTGTVTSDGGLRFIQIPQSPAAPAPASDPGK